MDGSFANVRVKDAERGKRMTEDWACLPQLEDGLVREAIGSEYGQCSST